MGGNDTQHLHVQLVFDTNILVDALTARGHYYHYAVDVLELVRSGKVEGWYAPHTLTTAYYLLERTIMIQAQNRQESSLTARRLLQEICTLLKPLPQVGDELTAIEPAAGDDLEDVLIMHLAGQYLPNPLIVTRDKWFLASSTIHAAHPKEIIENGLEPWNKRDAKLEFIDLATQQRRLRPQIQRNIHRVLQHGSYIMGPEIKELEARLADYVGVKHAITVASGTDSLEIALRALNIGPGDEVITVPFTWISTAEVIGQVGARPVFIDIEPATFNMNVDLLEAAITPRTKAILPVSLFGQMPDYGRINEIAALHGNIPVIEDGAQSFGATQHGRRSCGVTLIGSTSFFPAKPFGCYGDGGALFTNDDNLADTMRAIRTHGGLKRHHHPFIGMNGRLDTLQAAILLAKFDQFEWEVQRRGEIGARYSELLNAAFPSSSLSPESLVLAPRIAPGNTSVYAQYTIRLQNRDALIAKFKEKCIPCAMYYPKCLHEQPAFTFCGYQWGDFPEAEMASRMVLSLPMHPYLSNVEQQKIINTIINS